MENRGISCPVVQTSPGNSNSSNQPSPGAQLHSSPHPPQTVIDMNPATGPPVGALPAVQQVQAAPHMVAASVNYGKGNPVVSPPTANGGLMLTTPEIPVSQMMSRVPNHMLNMSKVTCWEGSGYAQNPQPHQNPQPQPAPQMQLRQQTHLIGGPGNMTSSTENSSMESSRIMPNPGASLGGMQSPTPAWIQLLHILKSPPSAQQQQQVLTILKSNPQLMAAYIKQKTAYQQHLNASNQSSPGTQLHPSPHPPQTVIGMNPATGPPVGALPAVQQVQVAPHMVAASVNYGIGNSGSGYAQNPQHVPQTEGAKPQRLIATMENRSISCPVVQTSPGNTNSSNQPSPGTQLHPSPHPPQRGIGMNPATGPPVSALQAVQQVQAAAARQTTPHMVAASVNYGKGNPVVSPRTANAGLMLTTPQMQKPMSQMMSGVPNHMLNMNNVTCGEGSGYTPNPQPHQNPQPASQTEKAEPQAKCPVDIKTKLRLQNILQRLQILERNIAIMENRGISCPVVQTSPGNSNSSNQPSPGVQLHSSPHPQRGMAHIQQRTAQKQQLRHQELEQGLSRTVLRCKVCMNRERSAVFQPRVTFFHVGIVLICFLTALYVADLLHIK